MKMLPAVLIGVAALAAGPAAAQAPAAPAGRDSSTATAAAASAARASWTSDRLPLRVGEILTVVVDEQTAARERVSNVASGSRSQQANFRAVVKGKDNQANIGSGIQGDSRDIGQADRQGDLTAVLSVRVTAIGPDGVARIEGSKRVSVDGRMQEVSLKGAVRAEDVSTSNTVLSSRIAEALITYKGKKIGPRTGIVGRILSVLWP